MRKEIWSIIRPYRIIRDVILVELFVGVGGFIAGYAAVTAGMPAADIPYSTMGKIATLVMAPLAFSIVGVINPKNRWYHLAIVAAIIFVESSFRSVFSIINLVCFLCYYVVGGLLSVLYPVFRNREKVETVTAGGA